ncbi:hypothetical protein [Actinomadura fibrosa]|uniref:Uncharacterized protein n=1 Tax=Actinomadura fibrosa TaxID=111802 RepID=A0ABW2XV83_9ACTN|nr:hypothetical protein [Actinomadura fibrosa]
MAWIGVAVTGAAVGLAGAGHLLDPSPPARAGRDAQVRAVQGVGLDPLTDQEMDKARAAALAGQSRAQQAAGLPQVVFVSADRRDDVDGVARRAEVRLYDYRTDEMVTSEIDLASGRVVGTERSRNTQPPAAREELRRAVELVLADPRLGPGLRAAYKAASGRALVSADEVHVRGRVFRAAQAAGAGGGEQVAQCGRLRCLTVSLKMPDSGWLDTSRLVIDMSGQRVHVLDR